MSHTTVYETDPVGEVSAMTRNRSADAMPVTVSTYKRSDNKGLRTYVYLSQEVAKATGLRAGRRVSILRGTGRDEGKIRIVANRKGSVKIDASLRVRTGRLATRAQENQEAQVTAYTTGALTIAL